MTQVRVFERYPVVGALLAQVLATLAIGLFVVVMAQLSSWRLSWLAAGLLQGALAAGIGSWLGLSRWWYWLNLAFVPALLLANGAALPSWVFLVGFVLVLLLNWNSIGERVPLYLTGARGRHELAALLARRTVPFRFIDLGCGPAGTLLWLSRRFPESQFVGVETAPLPFALAWLRSVPRRNCQIRYQNLWRSDLSAFDVAYTFLSPAPMAGVWDKARTQLPPGGWLISNTFEVPDVPPDEVVALDDWRRSRLLLWRIPE